MPDPAVPASGRVGNSSYSIGRYTYGFNPKSLRQWGEGATFEIGSFCSIARGLQVFLGGNHRTDWITTFPFGYAFKKKLGGTDIVGHPATRGNVRIGNDVWVGANATIHSGISIGDGAVIAAQSVVINDVAPYEIVGGNPAKHIKFRFSPEIIEDLLDLQWWNLPDNIVKLICATISQPPTKEVLIEVRNIVQEAMV